MHFTTQRTRNPGLAAAVLAGLGISAALPAAGDENGRDWEFRAIGYGYFPDIAASARFPTGGSADIEVSAGDLIENTHAAGMLAFEGQRGRFGGFADLVYMDVGDSIRDAPAIGGGSL